MTADLSWMERAACRGHDPDKWFPSKTGNGARKQVAAAEAICATCPVLAECRTFATKARIPHGVWGGRLRKSKAIASVRASFTPTHGTNNGYRWHMRHREPVCEPCRVAHRYACAEYMKQRKATA